MVLGDRPVVAVGLDLVHPNYVHSAGYACVLHQVIASSRWRFCHDVVIMCSLFVLQCWLINRQDKSCCIFDLKTESRYVTHQLAVRRVVHHVILSSTATNFFLASHDSACKLGGILQVGNMTAMCQRLDSEHESVTATSDGRIVVRQSFKHTTLISAFHLSTLCIDPCDAVCGFRAGRSSGMWMFSLSPLRKSSTTGGHASIPWRCPRRVDTLSQAVRTRW